MRLTNLGILTSEGTEKLVGKSPHNPCKEVLVIEKPLLKGGSCRYHPNKLIVLSTTGGQPHDGYVKANILV